MGTLAKIRRLHLREGVPIKEIERRTGIARNTIKSWLRRGQMVEPKYPARVMATKLDGFTEQLATWLKADAHRGKRDRRTVKLMYEELAAQGYRGGYGRVAAFAQMCIRDSALRPHDPDRGHHLQTGVQRPEPPQVAHTIAAAALPTRPWRRILGR